MQKQGLPHPFTRTLPVGYWVTWTGAHPVLRRTGDPSVPSRNRRKPALCARGSRVSHGVGNTASTERSWLVGEITHRHGPPIRRDTLAVWQKVRPKRTWPG